MHCGAAPAWSEARSHMDAPGARGYDGRMDRPEAALFRALGFIETHLDEDLTLERVAGEVAYSPFHFHRLFVAFTGESFAAYVRRLRMESGSVLLRSGRPVTDTALASGYWTHEAFTRAFRRAFGRAPRDFATEPVPGTATDTWLERPRRVDTPALVGWKRRVVGPYERIPLPGHPGAPWPPEAERCLGISWDDPSVTRADRIRYDAFWIGAGPWGPDTGRACSSDDPGTDVSPARIEGGPALAALHRGPFEALTGSYHYLLFMVPGQWGLRVHPIRPPYEEFVPGGILITVPLE